MPRKSRIDAPGALNHVMVRGVDRKKIFTDQKDYSAFMDRLGDLLIDTKTSCYAWALIPNHFHLLLRTGDASISHLMKRLLTGYAGYYNRRHKRYGHLFQDRYKSILCQEDSYLLELVRYIHLNPQRTALVKDYKDLADYPYCGHGIIMGRRKLEWQDSEYVLGFFGKKGHSARSEYSRFVRKGMEQGPRSELSGGGLLRSHGGWAGVKVLRATGEYLKGDERILGDGQFVEKVLKNAEERIKDKYSLKAKGYNLAKLINSVSKLTGVSKEMITDGIRDTKRTEARSILCYWATDKLGVTQSQLAQMLNLSQTAIVYAVRRGREIVETNAYLI